MSVVFVINASLSDVAPESPISSTENGHTTLITAGLSLVLQFVDCISV